LVFSFGGFTLCEAQAPWGNIPVKRRARSRARKRQLFLGIRACHLTCFEYSPTWAHRFHLLKSSFGLTVTLTISARD
jgi:hypothetical protein